MAARQTKDSRRRPLHKQPPFLILVVAFLVLVAVATYFVVKSYNGNGNTKPADVLELPSGFLLGIASSAYQMEGSWNESGKGESIWDRFTHTYPDRISDKSNGDVACNSYLLFKTDVRMAKEMGFDVYRFSISWSRVLPRGTVDYVNKAAIQHYHDLIDELLAHNITPLVTLYHWDLPQVLEDLGGWTNSSIADCFTDYADLMFQEYGDKVKWWLTINEPDEIRRGYWGTATAPARNDSGVADYLASHHMLRAHAKAYRLYQQKYNLTQRGKVTITLSMTSELPLNASSLEDCAAAERARAFNVELYSHPIFSKEGNYPSVVRERVDMNSYAEGRTESRLPHFTVQELEDLRGSWDFFSVNHYYIASNTDGVTGTNPSIERDSGVKNCCPTKGGRGLREVLNWIKMEYNNPPVFVTENGYSTETAELNDSVRVSMFYEYLSSTLKAINEDGCNVFGYIAWALMDNFEWSSGYATKYGLWQVDFEDANRTRTMKQSGYWFQELLTTRQLPNISNYIN